MNCEGWYGGRGIVTLLFRYSLGEIKNAKHEYFAGKTSCTGLDSYIKHP